VVQVGLPGSGAATDAAAATAAEAATAAAGTAGAAGEVGAIGGNVSESVSWTRAPLTAQGLLLPTAERPWVLLLRHSSARDASAAARRTDP
jgi:hypothetical protein